GTLDSTVFDRIRTVHGVFADVAAIRFADGAVGCLRRVRSADDVSVVLHGVFTFERDDDDRAPRHEGAELVEERSLAVDGIEALRHGPTEPCLLEGDDSKALLLKTLQNGALHT